MTRHLQQQHTQIQTELAEKGKNCFITERSVYSTLNVFAEAQRDLGNISQQQFEQLEILANDIPKPDYIVFLNTTPEQVLERIKTRNRECEKDITLEYLQLLDQKDDFWFKPERPVGARPVDVIDTRQKQEEKVIAEAINLIQENIRSYASILEPESESE